MTDEERRAAVCRAFERAPYYVHLGMSASSDVDGESRVVLRFDPKLTQLYGGIHGGALMSLADAAISIAVATTVAEDEVVATVDLSVQFVAPAGPRDVVAAGSVTRRGKRLAFGRATLVAGHDTVAVAQGIWNVSRTRVAPGG